MVWADLIIVAVGLVLGWLAARWLSGQWKRYESGRVTVFDHEVGLKYRAGKLTDIVTAGRYRTWPAPVEIQRLDLREQSVAISGQEILTADKLPVRVSAIVTYKIAAPRLYAGASTAPVARLYQVGQVALRERVAARTLDDLLADRNAVTAGMTEQIATELSALGLTVTSAKLLDLTLSGPAKQAFADLWKAQKEGQAALERARGEQAALRALANAARALKGNPELMNLRVLQALHGAPGKAAPTVVLGGASGLLPVSGEPAPEAPAADD